ncbi:MAG: ABC transporter ATP-binding protein, partial [Anaerolineae bacterium]|nr:ABC transporter ATP-binding protein [Anaerolineae bacterium]
MQAQAASDFTRRKRGGRPSMSMSGLLRAIRYLGRHRRPVLLAYGALVIATLAQLAVPNMLQNMLNAV